MHFLWSTIALCFLFISNYAQQFPTGEFNNWCYGEFAGVSFNTGSPVAFTGSAMNTNEGCATVSDAAGNLLFYTNGVTVWDKNHVAMTNGTGLLGHNTSTQSARIVPMPGSSNLYYIFTERGQVTPNRITYSIVDMNLRSGDGDITATKNVVLMTNSAEKLVVVKHCNNVDYWIVAHGFNNNVWNAYLLTSSGINTTPVTSNVGVVHGPHSFCNLGALKASPNGKRLGVAIGSSNCGFREVLDFNNATGVVSNAITLTPSSGAYGVEFSPNSQLVYFTNINGSTLSQFDLSSGVQATINASEWQGTSSYGLAALQLAPDGIIYVAHNDKYLGGILSPNTPGAGCNYTDSSFASTAYKANYGLPSYHFDYVTTEDSINYSIFNCDSLCFNLSNSYDSLKWNFGDPGSGASNTSTLTSPCHVFSGTGTYTIEVITFTECITDTLDTLLNINTATVSSFTVSTCNSYTVPSGNTTYTISGVYNDTIPNAAGCDSIMTINATINSNSSSTFSVTACNSYTSPSGNYTYTLSGSYNDTIPNSSGCDSLMTINVNISNVATSSFTVSTCGPYTVPSGNYTYTLSGVYMDTIPSAGGCDSIMTITANINTPSTSSYSVNACNSYTTPSGNATYTLSGTYNDTILNSSGCDSIMTVNLTIGTVSTSTITISDCNSYRSPSGNYTYTTSGVYKDTIPGSSGCDSVITIQLTIGQNSLNTFTVSACGDFYTVPSGDETHVSSGIYLDTISNAAGCDSLLTINLTINSGSTNSIDVSECGSYTSPSGNYTYSISGVYADTTTNHSGCDSIIQINLKILSCGFYLPNVFSPNNDGENDVFKAYGNEINELILLIYDRWGNLLFEGPAKNGWNGKVKGRDANKGVYVYQLNGTLNGKSIQKKGNVTLIR